MLLAATKRNAASCVTCCGWWFTRSACRSWSSARCSVNRAPAKTFWITRSGWWAPRNACCACPRVRPDGGSLALLLLLFLLRAFAQAVFLGVHHDRAEAVLHEALIGAGFVATDQP